ncbi:putative bifunctional transcriptional activator/DNA repair enzyme AlkA [Candidatus Protochlamydia amoebophila]|nr:putative bifunctional transcriptional activator/DNA repair enzyme AlkA [Candidatus Protochlamydia amoebophila]
MKIEQKMYFEAYLSRDARFDGLFYVGVLSTGIYCRCICPARRPKESNCRFFKSTGEAEKEFFRPCLRCRPELAPGQSPVDDAHRLANLLISSMQEGLFDELGLEDIALKFNLSSRQIRRVIQKEFGVSPIQLLLTRRLLLAKQLLTDTDLSVIDIAFASGFSSLRRFNDAFKKHYRMPPSQLKKECQRKKAFFPSAYITLQLNYRPPYDWIGFLNFLSIRSLKGIELVKNNCYLRTVQIREYKGWIHVSHVEDKRCLRVKIASSLVPVLAILLERIRNFFDLNARPDKISVQLGQDPFLAKEVAKNPGLRVPGTFDGFELAFRAILGQQITVKAATTLASRFVKAFGEEFKTPFAELHYLCPSSQRISSLKWEEIATIGIIRARAQTIIELAKQMSSNTLKLEAGVNLRLTIKQLTSIAGIGEWTAHYIALRALQWPDAFPKEDVALRKKLGKVTARQAEKLSQMWRPWRSYATLYLWQKKD